MKVLMAEALNYDHTLHVGNHQYAELFSKNGYEVLWLNPIYSNLLYFNDKEDYLKRQKYHKEQLTDISKNLYQYSPKSLFQYGNYPIFKLKNFNKLSIDFAYPNIKKILKENNFLDVDILWLSSTKYYYLKDIVNYKKLFYRCSDDISGFKNTCKSMLNLEENLIKEADTVFITSKDLLSKKCKIRHDLVYLPNGVDLSNFIKDEYKLPDEYKRSNNRKCIFVGALHNWVDIDLIHYCCSKLNNIDFYMVGPINTNLSSLNECNNVHIIGKKNYNEIPDYLYYADVAIIPFKINNLTNSITPVKLYEYMSAGLNVVSTNFKEMQYINSPAYIAENYEEFCKYIIQSIETKEQSKRRNILFAKENTWKKRFELIKSFCSDK
jgi:hypothetical protein